MKTNDKVSMKLTKTKKRYARPAVRCVGRVSGLTLKLGSNTDMQGGHL